MKNKKLAEVITPKNLNKTQAPIKVENKKDIKRGGEKKISNSDHFPAAKNSKMEHKPTNQAVREPLGENKQAK